MLIKIVCIGKFKDRHLEAKYKELLKWIGPYAKVEVVELRDSSREKESESMRSKIDPGKEYIFILSEEGKTFTSHAFSETIAAIDRKIVFVIGGPYGMTPELKQCAHTLMALSPMTMTHEMARLFLVEQLYRAISIARGGKYHND